MSQEVQVPYEDDGCRGVARLGQLIVSGRLRWYRSIRCSDGLAIEEDGDDFPPEWFRAMLVNEGGWWEVLAGDANRVALLKLLRSLFGLSMSEAAARADQFPLVFRGTKTEAEWMQEKLLEQEIASDVKRSISVTED